MLAMPVATISFCVLASSQEECTSALRPRLSGIHNAAYPHSSTRFANAAAAVAVMLSIEIQTPSFPSSIAGSPADDVASVNRRNRFVQPVGTTGTPRERDAIPACIHSGMPTGVLPGPTL